VIGILLGLALYISFIVDVLRTPGAIIRSLPKALWLLIVVLIPLIGGVLWLLAGRPRQIGGGLFRRRQPVAPDDDPSFLKALDEEAWKRRMQQRRGQQRPDPSANG